MQTLVEAGAAVLAREVEGCQGGEQHGNTNLG